MKDVDSLTAVNNFKYFGVDTKDVWREIIQAQANTLEFLGLKKMSFKLFWSLFVQGRSQSAALSFYPKFPRGTPVL